MRKNQSEYNDLVAELNRNGYTEVREIPGQGVCAIYPMLFTTGLFVDLTIDGTLKRFCYESAEEARIAIQLWDGEGDPPGNWLKEKPGDRRGPGLLNKPD